MTALNHELFDFVRAVTRELAEEYGRIKKRSTEDSGTAGDEGEENWADLLREWLPPAYKVVTKGRILGHQGSASHQVDVIVLRPSYPPYLVTKKLYLAAGVAAAFECKLTLKASHIEKFVSNCVEIKRLFEPRRGTPYREFTTPILYGLLAHSHSWKGEKSKPLDNIIPKFDECESRLAKHPREMADLICVADLVTLRADRRSYMPIPAGVNLEIARKATGERIATEFATTGFYLYRGEAANNVRLPGPPALPVGIFLCFLLRMLAWEDPSLRSLADYFRMTGMVGCAMGTMRKWPLRVFSDEVRVKLLSLRRSTGAEIYSHIDWDEWALSFTCTFRDRLTLFTIATNTIF